MKKIISIIIALVSILVANAQIKSSYLYHGEPQEITINSNALLVYFDASLTDTAHILAQYNCLRSVMLDTRMAESLIAYEIAITDEDYNIAVNRLKQLPEVHDVEPVIGTDTRVPVSNEFYVQLYTDDDTVALKDMAAQNGAAYKGRVSSRGTWYTVEVSKASSGDALDLSTSFGETGLFADVDPGFIFELEFNTTNCPGDPDIVDQ